MAVRSILTGNNRILRIQAKPVFQYDATLSALVDDLWDTLASSSGVGLAAPQIGVSVRVCVAAYEDQRLALVNPTIMKQSAGYRLGAEGCLSFPDLVADDTPRAATITIKGYTPEGKPTQISSDGWLARILQHEIDHLDGVLFPDRCPPGKLRSVTQTERTERGRDTSRDHE